MAIYYNRLSAVLYSVSRYYVQPTIGSALPGDITTNSPLYRLSALLYLAIYENICSALHSTIRYTFSVDTSTDCTLSRLSALPTIRSALSDDLLRTTICCALLYLASLQLSITEYPMRSTVSVDSTTEGPLCSVCRYYNRLFYVLHSVC
jgi:hypothetical protein